jgi:N6-L-threonylcarbamoyladenine synthase
VYYMKDMWEREKLGQTQDDAAWEAFDKVAKMMWLGYPGGPIVSKLAAEHEGKTTKLFPRVFLEKSEFGFSFSGLKSAVKREVDKRWELTDGDKQEISFEFQAAVNEVLCYKLIHAAEENNVKTILLAWGVSANDDLNSRIQQETQGKWYNFFAPIKKLYCMDNAAMIGILAYYRIKYNQFEHQVWWVKAWSW